jgi:hypothetical protein
VIGRRKLACLSAAVLAVLALMGCPPEEDDKDEDEPHPLTGIYTTTTHTVAEPCDGEAAAPGTPITRFKLADAEFFFSDVLGFFDCSESLDPAQEELDDDGCSTSLNLNFAGMPPADTVQITSCSCFEDTCAVGGTDGGWQETGDGAELVVDRFSGDVPNPDAPSTDCEPPELFEANRDALTCEQRTTIAGTLE